MEKVTLAQLPERLRQRPQVVLKAVIQTLQNQARTVGLRYVQEEVSLSRPQPVDRGAYRRGFQAATLPEGAVLFNPVLYASTIESGRRPGKGPPPGVLVDWVLRKGLVRDVKGKSSRLAVAKGIAYVIGRKIAKEGQPARRIMAKAWTRWRPELLRAVGQAVATGEPQE